jgi:hypothetical protein
VGLAKRHKVDFTVGNLVFRSRCFATKRLALVRGMITTARIEEDLKSSGAGTNGACDGGPAFGKNIGVIDWLML